MVIQRSDYSSQSIALINHWRVNEPAGPMRCLELYKRKTDCNDTMQTDIWRTGLSSHFSCVTVSPAWIWIEKCFPLQRKVTEMYFWHCRRYQCLWVFTQGQTYILTLFWPPSPEKPVPSWLPLSDWIWSIFFFSNSTSESFAIQWRQKPLCLPRHL